MRLTLACPVALRDEANQLARALGRGPDDEKTFDRAYHVDASGEAYCVASMVPGDHWIAAHQAGKVEMPDWGADATAAQRALDAMAVAKAGATVAPDTLLAIPHLDGAAAIARAGLTVSEELAMQ